MPAPSKRTRNDSVPSTVEQDDNPTTPTQSSSRRSSDQRRTAAIPSAPNRPILTRSITTQNVTPTPLTRSFSLFVTPRSGLGGNRGGTLVRTQSTPTISSSEQLKVNVNTATGGSGVGGKGDVPAFEGDGFRRSERGKENIPPKKDDENSSEASRKRIRVSRTRSGSVASMRSEGGELGTSNLASIRLIFSVCYRIPSFRCSTIIVLFLSSNSFTIPFTFAIISNHSIPRYDTIA